MALAVLNLASQARFSPGQVVMTAGVDELVRQGRLDPSPYLRRHLHGDWGDLDDSDRRQNDAALKSGEDRLFSSYQVNQQGQDHINLPKVISFLSGKLPRGAQLILGSEIDTDLPFDRKIELTEQYKVLSESEFDEAEATLGPLVSAMYLKAG
ncbi:MAG: hypothetical protein AzoDbin1_04387 [Azoarcus sp.]|nr:hypothetical protein [Azoarcus sp.]